MKATQIRKKPIQFIYIFLFSFVFQTALSAQSLEILKSDVSDFYHTGTDLGSSILNADSKSWMYSGLAIAGIAGLTLLDKPVRNFATDSKSDFNDNLFSIDKYYGNKWYMLGGISLVYLGGFASGNNRMRQAGLLTAEAYFYTALFTVVTKEIFGRERPYMNNGPYSFKPFRFKEDQRSFFSGHSSTVTAVSVVMADQVDNIFWKGGWYAAAVVTGCARMYHDKHWFSDVVTGGLVGYLTAQFVLNRHKKQTSKIQISASPMRIYFAFQLN